MGYAIILQRRLGFYSWFSINLTQLAIEYVLTFSIQQFLHQLHNKHLYLLFILIYRSRLLFFYRSFFWITLPQNPKSKHHPPTTPFDHTLYRYYERTRMVS